jgi:membrane associated rhomboid family serine protease
VIPLKDNIPSRTTPVVNYSIIITCGVVFLMQLAAGRQDQGLVERYGMIPVRVTHPNDEIVVRRQIVVRQGPYVFPREVDYRLPQAPLSPYLTLITCMFLHGGWLHILGNMLFLYIFGDNVEDRLGHVGYAAFYLFTGVLAGVSHLLSEPNSVVPTIGASGAIAGVMGSYFLLYPHARVLTVIPIFFFLEFIVLPAWLLLGFWFVIQLFQSGMGAATPNTTGVAWWAHIGGFAVGAGLTYALRSLGALRRELPRAFPVTSAFRTYRSRSPW